MSRRFRTILLLAAFPPLCWLLMQAVHELGHVLAAWATGGTVAQVVLHPLTISRTDVSPNPAPLVVVWAGPLAGVLVPLIAWGIAAVLRLASAYLFRFFAGFCLVANGAYVGLGAWWPVGDAAVMLRLQDATWPLWLFGLVCVPAGLWLWHGLGPRFGWGEGADDVAPRHVLAVAVLLAVVTAVELAAFGTAS